MNLELDKILKSAEYVFDGVKDADQVIDYIRVLVDKFHQRDSKNALVQIHAPDMTMISQSDLDKLTALREENEKLKVDKLKVDIDALSYKHNDLKVSYDALSRNYDQLEDRECNAVEENIELKSKVESLTKELEHLRKAWGRVPT